MLNLYEIEGTDANGQLARVKVRAPNIESAQSVAYAERGITATQIIDHSRTPPPQSVAYDPQPEPVAAPRVGRMTRTSVANINRRLSIIDVALCVVGWVAITVGIVGFVACFATWLKDAPVNFPERPEHRSAELVTGFYAAFCMILVGVLMFGLGGALRMLGLIGVMKSKE